MFSHRQQGIFDQYRWLLSRIQWGLDGLMVVLLLLFLCWFFGEPFRLRYQLLGLATFLLTVMIFQAAQEVGLSEQEVIDYTEENHKIRGFLDRLFGPPQPVAKTRVWKEDMVGTRTVEELQLTEEALVALVQKAVRSAHRANGANAIP